VFRKFITFLIVVSMLMSSMLMPVMAVEQQKVNQFSDISKHWGSSSITKWTRNGLISGYKDGTFKPNGFITRAEFCALINKVFGYSKKSTENYSDVLVSKWYTEVSAIAKAAGYTKGWADNTFEGNEPIKREEAVLALVNAFQLSSVDKGEYLSKYTDLKAYKGIAKDAIAAMIANAVISGYPDKTFRPEGKISRAESIVLFNKIIGSWINTSGNFSDKVIQGNVVINTAEVTLKDAEITGNLYLAEGIGEGEVTLNNVKVKGKTFISGGGENSINIDNSVLAEVIVNKENGKIRIADSGSTIGSLIFKSGGKYESVNSSGTNLMNIVIDSSTPPGQIIELSGSIGAIVCNSPKVIIKVLSGTKVASLTISSGASGTELVVDGKVTSAIINADNVKVNGTPISNGTTMTIDSTTNKSTGSNSSNNSSNSGIAIQAPIELAVSMSAYNSASLNWAQVIGATGYNIYRCATIDGEYTKVNTSAIVVETSYTDMGLSAGTNYYYKVSAVNASGESAKSAARSIKTAPQTPTGLAVSFSANNNSINLSWTPVTDAASYRIYRSNTVNGIYEQVNASTVIATSYTDAGLSAGTDNYYKVSAINTNGESDKSIAGFAKIPATPVAGDWKLVWNDEFNSTPGTGVDTDKWTYEVSGDGFGNSELQYTTDKTDNVYIEQDPNDPNNRLLTIKAIKENYLGKEYTSGRIKTGGKFDFTYGKVEMKAKLPYGNGVGCSLWMLGSNFANVGWPASGEIDIMEWVGKPQSKIYGTIHGPGYSAGEGIGAWHENSDGFSNKYHTYAVEWEPNVIRWYLDGKMYAERTPEDISGKDWVFDHDFNIILGLGVGGTWPGNPDGTTVFPQKYTIDYVRVYQRAGDVYPVLPYRDLVKIKNVQTNKFVTTDKQNGDYLYSNRDSAGAWETYELKDLGKGNTAIISLSNYKYLSVSEIDLKLVANKETIGDSETFQLSRFDDGTTALKCSANNKYVTISDSNILKASASSIGNTEKFLIYSSPEAPENLSANSDTNSSVDLGWLASEGATGYNVYRCATSNGTFVKVNNSAVIETIFTDLDLTAGTTYYYKVTALNANGESDYSSTLPATVPTELTHPAAPTGIKMNSSTENSVNLGWKAAVFSEGYNIYRSITSDGTYEKVNTTAVTGTSFTDMALTTGTVYYYKVTAENIKGESDKSGVLFASTSGYLISGAKSYSYIIAMANSKILEANSSNNMTPLKATASAAVSDSQLFEIIYKTDGDVGFASKALNQLVCADSWNVTDFQLFPRSAYSATPGDWESYTLIPQDDGTMAIRAKNGGKYVSVDASSGILRATSSTIGINEKFIIVTPNTPSQPTGLTVTKYLDKSVDLSWTAPKASAVVGFNVYRANTSGGEYNKVNTTLVTTSSFTDVSVVPSTTYFYKVAALNARGETKSSEVTVTTRNGALPATPTGLNIGASTSTSVDLNWTTVADADKYNVYRSASRFGTYTKVDTVDTANYSASGSGYYYYEVTAENENGETAFSEPVSLEMSLFGSNVYVFSSNDLPQSIQKICDEVYENQKSAETAQFGDGRVALFFKPGTYNTSVKVGYYTQVAGLGQLPTETTISGLTSEAALPDDNSTCNFWRSAENLTVNSDTKWAVSQAVSLRRMNINGNLALFQAGGWASGGYLADSYISGETNSGGQQQWFSRNTDWSKWGGNVWNMVFVGIAAGKAPAGTWPETNYTTVEKTPVVREKPFLTVDEAYNYSVFVPKFIQDVSGVSWKNKTIAEQGESISLDEFYIANAQTDTVATINSALSQGKHLLLTPGKYYLDQPIEVKNADTVVLGLGLASLISTNGNACMKIADVDGVKVAGILFDAGVKNSPVLLEVGEENSSVDHSSNPTSLSDLYFRVGGAGLAKADVCITVNSNNVIGDNFWVWRADHGEGSGWDSNTTINGMVVNGDDVTMYALMVEHFHQYQTLWNGNGGRTYFYQSEIPYDVPDQAAWMSHDGTVNGYASYKVADSVTSHEAFGLGIYSFHRDATIDLNNAMEVPDHPDVKIHNVCAVMLAGNPGISHVINNLGGAVTKAGQRQAVTEYSNVGKKVMTPVMTPSAGTYTSAIQVTMKCGTVGSTIRYTTDGTTPTETSTEYNGAINVANYASITVRAFKAGLTASDVVTANYSVDETAIDRSIIDNGNFNTDTTGWDKIVNDGSNAAFSVESNKLKVNSTNDGPNTWSTMLMQGGLPLGVGKTYVLSLDISADIARDINLCIESGANNTIKYLDTKTISILKDTTTTYTFEFIPTSQESDAKLVFLMGASSKGAHSIYLDNVVLWEKDLAAPDQVKTPTISQVSGTYNVAQTISLTCATAGTSIRYTDDGSEPTAENGTVYTAPFKVSDDKTIKAIAYKDGLKVSAVASETYTFTDNFALNKQAKASAGGTTANRAFDGMLNTRWESGTADSDDPQWITVDLGASYSVSGVKIAWEGAAASVYKIQVSNDAAAWTDPTYTSWIDAYSTTDGKGGETRDIAFNAAVTGQYVRMYATSRLTGYGYSIWDLEVYANKIATPAIANSGTDTEKSVTITCTSEGASIRYTTDGTTPTSTNGTLYAGPFNLSGTTTVKAVAYKMDMKNSNITSSIIKFSDNLAKDKITTALTGTAGNATDGNANTRWESAQVDPQWITVDLGKSENIRKVILTWETSAAKDYKIQVSDTNDSNATWTNIITKTAMPSGHTMDETLATPVSGRYVRMYGTARATAWGYSIFEFEIYGAAATTTEKVATPVITPLAGTYTTPQAISISCETAGATIRYTLDGTTPTKTNGTEYTGAFDVTTSSSIQVIAYKDGMTDSEVASAQYVIEATVQPSNLILNGTFDTNTDNWIKYVADWEYAKAEISVNAGSLKVDSTYAGYLDWHVQLSQTGLHFEAGKTYTLSFDIKGTLAKNITVAVEKDVQNGVKYLDTKTITLSSTMTTYTYEFTATQDESIGKLVFLLGGCNLENQVAHSIDFDNVILQKK